MQSSHVQRLRYAVIGAGAGIFNSHRAPLAQPEVELVGVSDINLAKGQKVAAEYGCAFYEDYRLMLAETRPDVAVLLTPPFLHASMACACFEAGCHVLTEKPMAIQINEADEMIAAAKRHQRLLGVILQQRNRPEIQEARRLLGEGMIGELQRVEFTAVWTRPTSYFAMAPWRATWTGEGGGVLTNQASHNLDLLCYLVGSPTRLFAWTRRLLHQIETEDTVQAQMEWANGALGSLHISTAEADDSERIKLVGTRGILEIGHGKLLAQTNEMDIREYARVTQNPYGALPRAPLAINVEPGPANHLPVYRSFHNAVISQSSDYCDGEQARAELELANAIIYSNYTHREVELPLDGQAYAALLADLQHQSRASQESA
ncbi:MAG TPA: Gfo/Idh/MocA family oxidoreductase [Ktedonobacteraceae bacterium]|nr:Gfo/Idh/MocA family oxidoreductase [Ktedonobacteraceae bacterium]